MDYHFKSWSGLNKQLSVLLCDSLRERITYFLHFIMRRTAPMAERRSVWMDGSWFPFRGLRCSDRNTTLPRCTSKQDITKLGPRS